MYFWLAWKSQRFSWVCLLSAGVKGIYTTMSGFQYFWFHCFLIAFLLLWSFAFPSVSIFFFNFDIKVNGYLFYINLFICMNLCVPLCVEDVCGGSGSCLPPLLFQGWNPGSVVRGVIQLRQWSLLSSHSCFGDPGSTFPCGLLIGNHRLEQNSVVELHTLLPVRLHGTAGQKVRGMSRLAVAFPLLWCSLFSLLRKTKLGSQPDTTGAFLSGCMPSKL